MCSRIDRWLCRAEEVTVALLLGAATLILFADVMLRFLINDSFSWAAESVRYAIVWTVFIGSSIAVRRGVHISIDVLREALPKTARRPLVLLLLGATVVFCALLLWYGGELVRTMRGFRQVSPTMQIPMWWVYLALPVGAGLMLLRLIQAIWAEFSSRRPPEPSQNQQIVG